MAQRPDVALKATQRHQPALPRGRQVAFEWPPWASMAARESRSRPGGAFAMAHIAAPGCAPSCAPDAASPCRSSPPCILLGLRGAAVLVSARGATSHVDPLEPAPMPRSLGSCPVPIVASMCALSMSFACASENMPICSGLCHQKRGVRRWRTTYALWRFMCLYSYVWYKSTVLTCLYTYEDRIGPQRCTRNVTLPASAVGGGRSREGSSHRAGTWAPVEQNVTSGPKMCPPPGGCTSAARIAAASASPCSELSPLGMEPMLVSATTGG